MNFVNSCASCCTQVYSRLTGRDQDVALQDESPSPDGSSIGMEWVVPSSGASGQETTKARWVVPGLCLAGTAICAALRVLSDLDPWEKTALDFSIGYLGWGTLTSLSKDSRDLCERVTKAYAQFILFGLAQIGANLYFNKEAVEGTTSAIFGLAGFVGAPVLNRTVQRLLQRDLVIYNTRVPPSTYTSVGGDNDPFFPSIGKGLKYRLVIPLASSLLSLAGYFAVRSQDNLSEGDKELLTIFLLTITSYCAWQVPGKLLHKRVDDTMYGADANPESRWYKIAVYLDLLFKTLGPVVGTGLLAANVYRHDTGGELKVLLPSFAAAVALIRGYLDEVTSIRLNENPISHLPETRPTKDLARHAEVLKRLRDSMGCRRALPTPTTIGKEVENPDFSDEKEVEADSSDDESEIAGPIVPTSSNLGLVGSELAYWIRLLGVNGFVTWQMFTSKGDLADILPMMGLALGFTLEEFAICNIGHSWLREDFHSSLVKTWVFRRLFLQPPPVHVLYAWGTSLLKMNSNAVQTQSNLALSLSTLGWGAYGYGTAEGLRHLFVRGSPTESSNSLFLLNVMVTLLATLKKDGDS